MRWIATAVGLISLFLPHTGHAEPEVGVVIVTGKVGPHDQAVAMGAVERRVRAAGWSLFDPPLTPREVDAVMGCFLSVDAWPCVARMVPKAARDHGVGRLAAVTLNPQASPDGARQLVISERLVLANAASIVVGQRFCEPCTDDTLAVLAGELAKELLDRAALRSGRTVLSVKSTPPRARYSVDGTVTGVTDATIDIVPGNHRVTIEHDGFEGATRTVDAAEGKTAEVSVTLERLDPSAHVAPAATQRLHTVAAALLAAGFGAIAGGVLLVAVDQGPTAKPRDQEQPRGYHDTRPAGVGLIVGGALVGGLGGYLWWQSAHEGMAPMVVPVAGGAVAGVRKAF
jgi:hypothetical protein